jgi:Holliday junction DNA helicase RuvA
MIHHLRGKLIQLSPAHAVVECNGVGYEAQISLNTFTALQGKEEVFLFTHLAVREDAHVLYGFSAPEERTTFRLLITVSGVGPNTARLILSSLEPEELQSAILHGDVGTLKSVKGIGAKSAQRIIVDLKDKMGIDLGGEEINRSGGNTYREEALSALEVLGFNRPRAAKLVDKLIKQHEGISSEELIKEALKNL